MLDKDSVPSGRVEHTPATTSQNSSSLIFRRCLWNTIALHFAKAGGKEEVGAVYYLGASFAIIMSRWGLIRIVNKCSCLSLPLNPSNASRNLITSTKRNVFATFNLKQTNQSAQSLSAGDSSFISLNLLTDNSYFEQWERNQINISYVNFLRIRLKFV